jgi:hypothetical protein
MSAASEPPLTQDEINIMKTFMDNGGHLYLSGVDIAYNLADQSDPNYEDNMIFLEDYLHASYVTWNYNSTIIQNIEGDALTGAIGPFGLRGGSGASTINPLENKFANQILPADTNATPIFQYFPNTNDYPGIRANHFGTNGTAKVVFTTFGYEAMSKTPERIMFAQKIIEWFNSPVGVKNLDNTVVMNNFELKQNYPNPFNPETRISYNLPFRSDNQTVNLFIYNQLGQKVRTLVSEKQNAGYHEVVWDSRDDAGKTVVSGVYFYKLQAGKFNATRKLLLLR